MANTNAPFGLRRISAANKSIGELQTFYVPSSYGTALFNGDAIVLTTGADSTGQYATVTRATAGSSNLTLGALENIVNNAPPGNLYKPASTEMLVQCCTDPDIEYEIQADEDIVAADIGQLADFNFGTSGSTTTGLSGMTLDSSTIGSGTQLRIIALAPNSEFGDYARVIVKRATPQVL